MTTNKQLAAAALTVAMGTTAAHAAFDASNFYVLGGLGAGVYENAKYDTDSDSFEREDDAALAWRLGAGYMFNDYFGVELNYLHLNQAENSYTDAVGDDVDTFKSAQSVPVLGVVRAPVNDFALFAKLGASYNIINNDVEVNGLETYSDEVKEWDLAYGFGGEYNVNQNVALQVEYLTTGEETSAVLANVAYKF